MAATPIINGINYSWGNMSVILYGNIVIGITKLSYKARQNKENGYGQGYQPVYRGYGNYEYEASMELYTDEWKKIIAAAPFGDPLQILPSDIQVVFSGSRVLPNKDTIQAMEFLENPFEGNQGDLRLMVTIPLLIAGIIRN